VIAEFRAGAVDAAAMLAAVRASVLIMPLTGAGQVLAGRARGVGWLYVFTSIEELARWARARDEGDPMWRYASIRGDRVLDRVVAGLDRPCGVAVDVAGARPMLLPPLPKVVPPSVALPDRTGARPGAPAAARGAGWPGEGRADR
jgi:hypothetical protein